MAETNWQRFFDGHAPSYMENCYVTSTLAEVDFVIEELGIRPGDSVLDVGCGTGRHSVELARRGFAVTGIDLSSGMLDEARKAADAAGVQVDLVQCDASQYVPQKQFDAVICLCEGAFGLLGQDDDAVERDLDILRMIASALKPGGGFIQTTLSGYRLARQHTNEDVQKDTFDPVSLSEILTADPGTGEAIAVRVRAFVPTEIMLMCRIAGLEVRHIWGGTAGNWGHRPIDLDEYEFMVVARKREG